jgi:hypothetical protein
MHKLNGAVAAGPVRIQRTRADVLADVVSLVVLAILGTFAVAVSFSHTMTFIRAHGQTQGWIVVGTACTVVLLTLQAGMEHFRDARAARGRGWPAVLLAVGVGVELYANMSTAGGPFLNKVVAGWPVPIAAAALALWTRRLQHAAEAEAEAEREQLQPLLEYGQEQAAPPADEDQEQDDDRGDDQEQEQGTVKERILYLLQTTPADEVPGPTEVALQIGCTKQYASTVITTWQREREQVPGGQQTFELAGATA